MSTKLPSGIPPAARKVAHYWYSDGNELVIFAHQRRLFVRDGKTGEHPISPVLGDNRPHPSDGTPWLDNTYDGLGLYYGFAMADIGWDGDC